MSRVRNVAVAGAAPDSVLALLGLALLMVGLVAISSASIEYADWHFQNPWFHTQRHLTYMVMALVAAVFVYRVSPQFWLDTGWVWLFVSLALLIDQEHQHHGTEATGHDVQEAQVEGGEIALFPGHGPALS